MSADQLRVAEEGIGKIVAVPDGQRTFDNTVGALDDIYGRLELDTNFITFMSNVSTDPGIDKTWEARKVDSERGNVDQAFIGTPVKVDQVYSTPTETHT